MKLIGKQWWAEYSKVAEYKIKDAIIRNEDKEILVIDENTETLPKTKAECPKCGHNMAFWVLRQMRAADESETRIYQCVKCKHKWREN